MLDDDRLKLKPNEKVEQKMIRFRTLGCYPLTGGVESEATTLPEIIQEMLLTKTSRATGSNDRQGCRRRRDGRKEEARLFLIYYVTPKRFDSKDILAYLDQHERKELLRFITCGSVDDGKSTLIGRLSVRFQDAL